MIDISIQQKIKTFICVGLSLAYILLAIIFKEASNRIIITTFFVIFSSITFFYKQRIFGRFLKSEVQRFIMLVYFVGISILVGTITTLSYYNAFGFTRNIVTELFSIYATVLLANISVYLFDFKIN